MMQRPERINEMRRKHFATVAICAVGVIVLLAFGFVPEACAFNEPELLTRHIRATVIENESIDQVLNLLAEYQIPVGIELGDPKLTPRREINLNLPETNLKDFLDSVIAKDTRYTWKLDGGVIHLWPLSGRDTFLTTLLDTKISHFSFTGMVSRYHIHNEIMNLPEIKSRLVVADVAPMIFLNSGNMKKLESGTYFDESNLTLRELLDRIIVKTDIKRWVLVRWGENSEFINLTA